MQHVPILKDILLVGGGHTHSLLIRKWGMSPIPGVRLTLVSRDVLTPYSGMLPGMVAGHYSREETHIDLARLCRWAGVRFVESTVTGLDLRRQQVLLQDRPALEYDLVSINTGSTPDIDSVPGASEFTVPVKPVHRFEEKWSALRERLETDRTQQRASATDGLTEVAVVGAGVGGFELLTSLDHALNKHEQVVQMHWFVRGAKPLTRQPARVSELAMAACADRNIKVHTRFDVSEVRPASLVSTSGVEVALDEILWVTAARGPEWPSRSGLATDRNGFIAVDKSLRSTSHDTVFAAGDIASLPGSGVAKAGVFAVRQAPVLFENLRRAVCGEALRRYNPQKNFLTLISIGDKTAIASRNGIAFKHDRVWQWKDWIDRQFMQKFSELPDKKMKIPTVDDIHPGLLGKKIEPSAAQNAEDDLMFCGGCGAKVGSSVLNEVVGELNPVVSSSVVSASLNDDCCTIEPGGRRLVQSVDQFRASFDDPYLFARVATLHALSDIYASGATPDSALALVTLPFSDESIQRRDLRQLMSGAVEELNKAGCMLAGGHTAVGAETMLGFTVNGFEQPVESGFHSTEGHADYQAGDAIVLSKPIGTGVIMAGDMRHKVEGVAVKASLASMLESNSDASGIFEKYGVRLVTDVTGFGLLGHLLNLLERMQNPHLQAELFISEIPLLPDALKQAVKGVRSSLYSQNAKSLLRTENPMNGSAQIDANTTAPTNAEELAALTDLLVDPQTNGGLLAVVPANKVADCLQELQRVNSQACVIGRLQKPVLQKSLLEKSLLEKPLLEKGQARDSASSLNDANHSGNDSTWVSVATPHHVQPIKLVH